MDHNKTQSNTSTTVIKGQGSQRDKVQHEEEKVPLSTSQIMGTPAHGMIERSVSGFDDDIPLSPEYHLSNHVGFGQPTEKGQGKFLNSFGGGFFEYHNEDESRDRLYSTTMFDSDICFPNFNQPTYPCSQPTFSSETAPPSIPVAFHSGYFNSPLPSQPAHQTPADPFPSTPSQIQQHLPNHPVLPSVVENPLPIISVSPLELATSMQDVLSESPPA